MQDSMPTDAPLERLVWQRRPGHRLKSFIAYPLGDDRKDVHAEVWYGVEINNLAFWNWRCAYGALASFSGRAETRDGAVFGANLNWRRVVAEGQAREALLTAQRDLLYRVERVARRNTVDIGTFRLEAMDRALLLYLIKACREQWEPRWRLGEEHRAIQALMLAVSTELYRRRVGS